MTKTGTGEVWGQLPIALDATDRELLRYLDAHPGAAMQELAEQLGTSARSVSRRFARLQERGVVRVLGRTLPGAEDRLAHLLRIQGEPAPLRSLATALASQPNTSWVRLSRDGTELICGTVIGSDAPDERLLGRVLAHPGVRDVRVLELLQVWRRAAGRRTNAAGARDELDHAILAALATNGRMPVRELAQRVGVDASTASRRRRRLLDDGVLYLEADIHPEALRGAGDAMLWLSVRPGAIQQLGAKLSALPEVRFAAATTGTSAIVVHVVVPAGSSVVAFVDEHLAGDTVTAAEIVTMGQLFKRINPRRPDLDARPVH